MLAIKGSGALSRLVGGIVAGASEENLQLVYDFGLLLGLAFQIKDDW